MQQIHVVPDDDDDDIYIHYRLHDIRSFFIARTDLFSVAGD